MLKTKVMIDGDHYAMWIPSINDIRMLFEYLEKKADEKLFKMFSGPILAYYLNSKMETCFIRITSEPQHGKDVTMEDVGYLDNDGNIVCSNERACIAFQPFLVMLNNKDEQILAGLENFPDGSFTTGGGVYSNGEPLEILPEVIYNQTMRKITIGDTNAHPITFMAFQGKLFFTKPILYTSLPVVFQQWEWQQWNWN